MTRVKSKIMATLLALFAAFSLASCVEQKDVDKAVKPVKEQIVDLQTADGELGEKIGKSEADVAALQEKIAALEIRINCLEGKHELVEIEQNGDGTHTGVCKHCEKTVEADCTYGELTAGEGGVMSKTCSACGHTVEVREDVTIALKAGANLSVYFEDKGTIDLSMLVDIPAGAGAATYTLTSATVSGGKIEGAVLSYRLIGEYTITVTTAQTATHKAGSFTFTVSVEQDPATGGFDGEWV